MGQKLSQYTSNDYDFTVKKRSASSFEHASFPDLKLLPPEIGVMILSHLDVYDVRTVEPFWTDLANDEYIWKKLCYQSWGYCSAYKTPKSEREPTFWRKLYSHLENGTKEFNNSTLADTLINKHLKYAVKDSPEEMAEFIIQTELLKTKNVLQLLQNRYDILDKYVQLHDFGNKFLPIAMRSFFFQLSVDTKRQNPFVIHLMDKFSERFCDCNPRFNRDAVVVLCHSLLLLSNDLCNPNIRNKMSKREFIKNTQQAMSGLDQQEIDDDFLCHAYDNVYLIGHIAPQRLDEDIDMIIR